MILSNISASVKRDIVPGEGKLPISTLTDNFVKSLLSDNYSLKENLDIIKIYRLLN